MNQPLQVKHSSGSNEAVMLLRAILAKQDEQNALLKALVEKQHVQTRATAQWKNEHPALSQRCKQATDKAARLMDSLIEHLVEDFWYHAGAYSGSRLQSLRKSLMALSRSPFSNSFS